MPVDLTKLNDAQKAAVGKLSAEELAQVESIFKTARKPSAPRVGTKVVLAALKEGCPFEEGTDPDLALLELFALLEVYFKNETPASERSEQIDSLELWNKANDKTKQATVLAYIKHLQKVSRKKREKKGENEVTAPEPGVVAPVGGVVDEVEPAAALPDFDDESDVDFDAVTGIPM